MSHIIPVPGCRPSRSQRRPRSRRATQSLARFELDVDGDSVEAVSVDGRPAPPRAEYAASPLLKR
jgi:hypothetical protein